MATPLSFDEGFVVPEHDYQVRTGATASAGPTRVKYYRGGPAPAGELLAEEVLTYDGNGNVLTRRVYTAPSTAPAP